MNISVEVKILVFIFVFYSITANIGVNEILKFIVSSLAISGIGLQAGTVCSLKHFLAEKLTNKTKCLLVICKA
jgi:hypothetical protein